MIKFKHPIIKIILLIVVVSIIVGMNSTDNNTYEETSLVGPYDTSRGTGYVKPVSNTSEEVEETEVKRPNNTIGGEDYYLLAKIAMAEAEGEDIIGKALVIKVIINRVESDQFPDTVYDVIYQKVYNSDYHQFSPIDDGRFDRVEPSEDCYIALSMVINAGWDKSEGALYFEGCEDEDNWHSRNLEFLFKHGNHRFYK